MKTEYINLQREVDPTRGGAQPLHPYPTRAELQSLLSQKEQEIKELKEQSVNNTIDAVQEAKEAYPLKYPDTKEFHHFNQYHIACQNGYINAANKYKKLIKQKDETFIEIDKCYRDANALANERLLIIAKKDEELAELKTSADNWTRVAIEQEEIISSLNAKISKLETELSTYKK